MSYPPDPGGNFASDVHRRTLAHLTSEPMLVEDLVVRMTPDAGTDLDAEEVTEVLKDLEADGHASETKDGWKQTKAGLNELQAPVVTDGE